MVENPLLPDAELRALLALLKRAARSGTAQQQRAAQARRTPPRKRPEAKSPEAVAGREALLAGTLLQLRPGDLLVLEPDDRLPLSLLPAKPPAPAACIGAPTLPVSAPQLLFAAGMAAALQASGGMRLVLALVRAGHKEPAWLDALTWAQGQRLPLVVLVADPRGSATFLPPPPARSGGLDWSSATKLAARLQLPVLTVDGEDAVAVYRVMQESALRARDGGGPAVLWAMLPSPKDRAALRPAMSSPVHRLARYLRARGIRPA